MRKNGLEWYLRSVRLDEDQFGIYLNIEIMNHLLGRIL